MKMCPMLLHNPGLKDIADSCAHRARDPRVEQLVEAARVYRYSQTLKSARDLDAALAKFEKGEKP